MRMLTLLLGIAAAACAGDAGVNVRRFQLTGVVVGRDGVPARVVVEHEAIGGFMPAMRMTFQVRGAAPPLGDGDRIVATLVVSDTSSWLEDVRVKAAGVLSDASVGVPRGLAEGSPVPDLPFVDQNGNRRGFGSFAGRVLVLTFVYTRCPLPDFCPLMVRHLESVRRAVNKAGIGARLALLGVTLDPAFDTPEVLRAYGKSVLEGTDPFEQWTLATGTPAEIAAIAGSFGVGYVSDRGAVTHSLVTTVVGTDGRVLRVFESNNWRPEDVSSIVQRELQRTPLD